MKHIEAIRAFLNRQDHDIPDPTGLPFITISRQTGADGHALGREILRKLSDCPEPELNQGWELFDQMLCAMLVQDPNLNTSFESLVAEEYRTEVHQTILDMFTGRTDQYTLYKKITEVIRLLAGMGQAIIVGRGGMCMVRDMPQGVRVRLVAPESMRVRNIMREKSISESEARSLMQRKDKERARMVQDFHHADLNNPLLFDVIWNAERTSLPDMAAAIVEIVRSRLAASHS